MLITGSALGDRLSGTSGNDTILGLGGNGTINGEAGDDSIAGGDGGDVINAGDGADTVLGGAGADSILGGVDNDSIDGGAGNDTINGGLGIDTINGGAGDDLLIVDYSGNMYEGSPGRIESYVYNPAAANSLSGYFYAYYGYYDEVSFTNIERLQITGTGANDQITTGSGNDTIIAGDGNDTIDAGSGNNSINGGAGDDTIDAGSGNNSIDGGSGYDTLNNANFSESTAALTINNPAGSITLSNGTFVANIEAFTNLSTGSGDDTIAFTTRGNDSIATNGGNDTINGGLGFDTMDGGTGTDLLIIDYSANTQTQYGIFSELEDRTLSSLSGYLFTYSDFDSGIANDDRVLFSNIEIFRITGTSKADWIVTGGGNDTINGGGGDDTIDAGAGNDTLQGGSGDDTIDGGTGINRVVFSGNRADYSISTIGGSFGGTTTVVDLQPTINGNDGTDTLTGVGLLQFLDQLYAINTPPLTVADSATTTEDTAISISLAGIIANDSDAEGDPLSITGISAVTNGTAYISGGNLVFTPAANFNGTGVVTYTLSDGFTTTPGTLSIAVTPVNDPPTATNLSAEEQYSPNTPQNLIDIVVSDIDSPNVSATLTISNLSAGSLSTATVNGVSSSFSGGVWSASGAIASVNALLAGVSYLPATGFNSSFSIATNVSDGEAPALTGTKQFKTASILDFADFSFRVNEDGTPIQAITINRSGNLSGSVSASIQLTPGTATPWLDYQAETIPIEFGDGVATKIVTAPIINDDLYEGDETIQLSLIDPQGGAVLGTQTTATLTIVDDDLPQRGIIYLNSGSYTVGEDRTGYIRLVRSNGSDGEVSVTITPADGSAFAPSDYTNTPITVIFADGETNKTVAIPVVDDSVYEATETVNLTLSNPTGGATLGTQQTAILNIVDNDAVPGTIQFSNTTYSINENGTPVTAATLTRTNGSDGEVSATIYLSNGSATSGSDYNNSSIAVSFANGETTKTVTIPIIDDNNFEDTETLHLSLANPTNSATIGTQNSAIVSIIDNDFKPTLSVNINADQITEGHSIQGTVIRNTNTTKALTVTLINSDTSQLTIPTTVTIPIGSTSANFTIKAVDDTLIELSKNYTVIATAQGFVSSSDSLAVLDNDAVTLSLSVNTNNINENGGKILATITRNIVTDTPLQVQLSSNDTTEATVPSTVIIGANQASATFEITGVDDLLLDGTQSVIITVKPTYTSSNLTLDTGNATRTINVLDNESPSLQITIGKDVISETGTATATITRNTDTNNELIVTLTSSDTSEATVPNTVTIPIGKTSAIVTITGVSDGINDGSQSVTIAASANG